jgi:hypothetical protein
MIRLLAVFKQESLYSVLLFNSEFESHNAEAAIRAVAGESADDLRFSHAVPDTLVDVIASFATPETDEYPPCPICGEPIDFCPGHGERNAEEPEEGDLRGREYEGQTDTDTETNR